MQRTPYVFPIIGGRKVEHMQANIKALEIALSDEHIKKIESAVPFFKGNLYAFFVSGGHVQLADSILKRTPGRRLRVRRPARSSGTVR